MKYLQISTVMSFGSIGRIMRQNYDEKASQGWECLIAYGRGDEVPGYHSVRIGNDWDVRIQGLETRLFDWHGYGSKKATRDFIKKMDEWSPDVVHLHNIHGYYINFEILFAWLKAHPERQVIWTLHDCWAFTGHCSYFTAVKCEQWKSHCSYCSQLRRYPKCCTRGNVGRNFDRKKAAFTDVPNLKLIVPSHWLEGLVKQSFLQEYPVEVVYNKIDTTVFKPTPSDFRERYGLQGKKIVLGVASVWEDRKGLNDFIKLAQMLDDTYAIVLVGLTEKQIKQMPKRILGIRRTNSPQELAAIYTAADVFVNPSVEETFGMTTVEAQACRTDTLVYQDTACEEIANQCGGTVVQPGVNSLYHAITGTNRKMGGGNTLSVAKLICIPRTANTAELAKIYTAADVFVNPTYEDNYPTVNLEAQACGAPVITYDTGGCRETLY